MPVMEVVSSKVFECDRSCGTIIEVGDAAFIVGAQVVCTVCAISDFAPRVRREPESAP